MVGMYFNNVRHFLENKDKGILEIIDPVNYKESNEEFARNKKHHGILTTFSSSIELIEDGKDYILDVKNNFGLNEIVKLRREERNPNTDEWETVYISTLDLITISEENNKLSVKISSDEAEKKLKARASEKVEIERLDTIDGLVLPELPTENLELLGRELLLTSLFDSKEGSFQIITETVHIEDMQTINVPSENSIVIPINQIHSSSNHVHEPLTPISINNVLDNGLTDMMLIANVPETIQFKTEIKGQYNFQYQLTPDGGFNGSVNSQWPDILSQCDVMYIKYSGGLNYIFEEIIPVHQTNQNAHNFNEAINVNRIDFITLNEGESIALVFKHTMTLSDQTPFNYYRYIEQNVEVNSLGLEVSVKERSSFPITQTKTILLKNLGERITSIILGKQGLFKSSILNNTLVGAYCGHWLRGFDKLPEDEDNKYKPFTTSFNDYAKSLKSVFNISMGIQIVNGEECIVAEKMEYFYNPNIAISLPFQVVNVKRSIAKEYIYSGVELGYEKGGEYEEVLGLDEPNGSVSYVSNMTATKNTYTYLSKYRADVYGEEIQRRKQKENSPTEDAKFDSDIFIKDLKRVSGELKERVWQDDFLEAPTGIYSPETAKNLRLSPARNLKRHGSFIGIALKHYQNKYLKFGSTTANSGMSTKLIGESSGLRENSNVLNSDLGRRRFEPEYIEFDHIVNYELLQQIKGITNFNGIETPNMYCKVKFLNENNEIEFGYIISIKTTGEGSWKLLKA